MSAKIGFALCVLALFVPECLRYSELRTMPIKIVLGIAPIVFAGLIIWWAL